MSIPSEKIWLFFQKWRKIECEICECSKFHLITDKHDYYPQRLAEEGNRYMFIDNFIFNPIREQTKEEITNE